MTNPASFDINDILESVKENYIGPDTHVPDSSINNQVRSFLNKLSEYRRVTHKRREIRYRGLRVYDRSNDGSSSPIQTDDWVNYTMIIEPPQPRTPVKTVKEENIYAEVTDDMWARRSK